MPSGKIFVIFVLPIILSLTLATGVMADVLDKPGRHLQMWPPSGVGGHGALSGDVPHSSDGGLRIVGLSESYSVGEQISVHILIDDVSFNCGDLYITIHDRGEDVLAQEAFFDQCFADSDAELPVGGDGFEALADSAGLYTMAAEMRHDGHAISAMGEFLVE